MRLSTKFTIGKKMFVGFALVLALMLTMGVMSLSSLGAIQRSFDGALDITEEVEFFQEREIDHLLWVNNLANSLLSNREFTGQLDHTACNLGVWYYDLVGSEHFRELPPDLQRVLLEMDEPHKHLHQSGERVNIALSQGDHERALAVYNQETLPVVNELRVLFEQVEDIYHREKNLLVDGARDQGGASRRVILFGSGVAILLAMAIAFFLTKGITTPMVGVVNRLREMAEAGGGDLTQRVEVKTTDELADLAYWFNEFVGRLRQILLQVRNGADTVAIASEEISIGNQDLSQRTEEQAASLEETSSTIEEITASLQHAADGSMEADRISRATFAKVKEGEEVVSEMKVAMVDITKSSGEIADIIATVNDIAFQTNLLALNAAVEAARAGEQGRGFAVVAAEVRNLAGRAAQSAKEIEALIKKSITSVDSGNHLMGKTETVLEEIIKNTQRTVDVIGEIAASMREQSTAADDIRTAVEQLNQVTQQNAAMVEEIASSSESMQTESSHLRDLIAGFTLDSGGQVREVRKPAAPRPRALAQVAATKQAQRTNGDDGLNDFLEEFSEDDFEKF